MSGKAFNLQRGGDLLSAQRSFTDLDKERWGVEEGMRFMDTRAIGSRWGELVEDSR